MKEKLNAIRNAALSELEKIGTGEELEQFRIRILGKKGELTAVLRGMGQISPEERPVIGQLANEVRAAIEAGMEEKLAAIREKAKEVCRRQIDAAAILGIDCILVPPGTVGVDFRPEDVVPDTANVSFFAGSEVIDYDVAYERSQAAFRELAPYAERKNVIIGIENIWNKFLLSPLEFRNFLDEIGSDYVAAFLDVGNMLMFGYPQHWIKILNKRIKKVHFKDFRRDVQRLSGFVDLLAGDVDWPAVIKAFDDIGYDGWASAECCPNYKFYTNQIVYNSSAAMDCILGRK